jgi:hypothetical protein
MRRIFGASRAPICRCSLRFAGLPEEVSHSKQCLARGYAVLALMSLNREYRSRCFSSSGGPGSSECTLCCCSQLRQAGVRPCTMVLSLPVTQSQTLLLLRLLTISLFVIPPMCR